MTSKINTTIISFLLLLFPPISLSRNFVIDPSHSFINFKFSHLGIGWVVGRFNKFSGTFTYDPNKGEDAQSALVEIQTGSLDSNHSERDRHLTARDYLDSDNHPTATFKSTSFTGDKDGGVLVGDLTLWGETQSVSLTVQLNGEGDDPWGGYRAGFDAQTHLDLTKFGFQSRVAKSGDIDIYIEGIRQ